MQRRLALGLLSMVGLLGGVAACREQAAEGNGDSRARASAPESQTATQVPKAGLERWVVVQSRTAFLARREPRTIRGSFSQSRGTLELDVSDLLKTRGKLLIDLRSLETTTFDDVAKDRAQTAELLTRLGLEPGTLLPKPSPKQVSAPAVLVPGPSIAKPARAADENRFAQLTIRDVQKASPLNLQQLSGALRKARLSATADLSLHGRVSQHRIELEVTVAFAEQEPKTLALRTVQDVPVALSQHGLSLHSSKQRALKQVEAREDGRASVPAAGSAEQALFSVEIAAERVALRLPPSNSASSSSFRD